MVSSLSYRGDVGDAQNSRGMGRGPKGRNQNRPGRQAGKGFVNEMSAEGAAHQRVARLRRSSNPLNLSRPDGRAY